MSQRPRSAADSARLHSQSLGKFMNQQSAALDEKTVTSIWHGLGQYIAKQMRNGKGVFIPKFGNFTFSAPIVDLAGTTNPQVRDGQHRIPVFLVGKDFVSAVTLRTGIAHNGGSQLRPYDIKGASGIIPKVKINYTEVASYCGQSKDTSRNGCEQVYRFLSDKVRKGENVTMDIPFIGTFIVRGGIAAVSYLHNLQEETKGSTAKIHLVNKLFANSNNRMNMQIHDDNKSKLNPCAGMGGAMKLTGDAENWLKSNLNISVQELINRQPGLKGNYQRIQSAKQLNNGNMNRYGSARPEEPYRKSWAMPYAQNGTLTEQNKAMFDRVSDVKSGVQSKRPMSAVTRGSRMSNVPEVGRMKLMLIATEIYKNRQNIMDLLQQQKQSIRNVVSSSEIQQILKKCSIFVEIGNIKALLRDLGFNWNGPACSVYELFQTCKTYLYGQSSEEEMSNTYFEGHNKQYGTIQSEQNYTINKKLSENVGKSTEQILQQIKDLFYSSGKSVYELYSQAKLGNNVDYEGLKKLMKQCSNMEINEQELQSIFKLVAKGKDSIPYQEFEKAFKWDMPSGGEWEIVALRRIRDWIIKNGLSSETAFDRFLKITGKYIKKRLTRIDFHKAFNFESGLNQFSAPEIDALFVMMDLNKDGELDVDEWKTKIYEDSNDPLQMLREIVSDNNLTPDDLIFKMHLRYWDAPLDLPQFCEAMRRLDPTLSETQLRLLAKTLKGRDNKVEITTLLRNLCGTEHETVDYRNKIFRALYSEIHPNKSAELMKLLEDADPLNDGRVEPQGLKFCLRKVVTSLDEDSIDRFVRFLDKDKSGKINYMEFMGRMGEVSNRDHNPLKSVVQRIAYFITSNNQSVLQILRRLLLKTQNNISGDQVTVSQFAQFLKAKIDKKRDYEQLKSFAFQMDIDKDGFISEIDLQTCINNLNTETFFKNSGEALAQSVFSSAKKFFPHQSDLTDERANDIMKQVRTALINKKIAYKEAFNKFDANKDGFLNFIEFSQGIDTILTLSVPIKEKVFALMDNNQIGLVDYSNFLQVIQMSSAYKPKTDGQQDNFDWENSVIEKIKAWIWTSKVTVEEAFKSFDKDFDGIISKEDLKWALVNVIQVKEEEIYTTKLDRLFKLMDFYKTNQIQLTDFQRLVSNENPYSTQKSIATPTTENFRKSFGGGFLNSGAFDWKVSVIQQIGLIISKQFKSIKDSFEDASEHLQQVTFDQFKAFIDRLNALRGFNLTVSLLQKVFSEIDPHKKGHISEQDWNNAFSSFNWNEQMFIELKNTLACSFADCDSAFSFILTFKAEQKNAKQTINYNEFEKAIASLTTDRFKKSDIQSLWKFITNGGKVTVIDKYQFRSHFDNLKYTGNSAVRNLKSSQVGARTTIYTQSSSSSTWDQDIFEKLRQIIRTSSHSFEDIFREFDSDGNGSISEIEFRNALRKLNLGLKSREIDMLMQKIDTNSDGKIDWKEFISKFKTSDLDDRLKERAKDKMARIKELMIMHMTSPNDAFRFVNNIYNYNCALQFDSSKLGKLTYQDFSKLAIKLSEVSGEKIPSYPVIKDLFDTIDVRKDGIIDMNEWQQTFGNVVEGNNKLSIKATPLTMWENSREFQDIGSAIARNRKTIKENHEKVTNGSCSNVTFEQLKEMLMSLINQQFKGMSDDKLKCVVRVAEVQGSAVASHALYDISKLLDVYKARHAGPQL